MKQCLLVCFICPLPRPFIHPPPFALSLRLPMFHSWGSAIVLVIAEECTGFLCQCVCVWRRGSDEKWGRWRQFINTWVAHGGVLAEGGEAAQSTTLRVFLFSSAASDRQQGGYIKRGRERGGEKEGSFLYLQASTSSIGFSLSANPFILSPSLPSSSFVHPRESVFKVLLCKMCNVRSLIPPFYAICISVGVETDDWMPIEMGNERKEKLFHSPMMSCHLSLWLPPTVYLRKPSLV